MRNVLWWAVGGFVVYEVVAWKVNDSRIAASRGGGSYTPMPFDLIGKYIGYPKAGLGPEIQGIPVPFGQPSPSSVNRGFAADFDSTNYPGVAPMPAVPRFNPLDPLGLGL
jgi:hypothetical protein